MSALTFFTQSTAHLICVPMLLGFAVLYFWLRSHASVGRELDDENDDF